MRSACARSRTGCVNEIRQVHSSKWNRSAWKCVEPNLGKLAEIAIDQVRVPASGTEAELAYESAIMVCDNSVNCVSILFRKPKLYNLLERSGQLRGCRVATKLAVQRRELKASHGEQPTQAASDGAIGGGGLQQSFDLAQASGLAATRSNCASVALFQSAP